MQCTQIVIPAQLQDTITPNWQIPSNTGCLSKKYGEQIIGFLRTYTVLIDDKTTTLKSNIFYYQIKSCLMYHSSHIHNFSNVWHRVETSHKTRWKI